MNLGRLLLGSAALPLRTAAFGVKTATTVAGISADVATVVGASAVSTGLGAVSTGLGAVSTGIGLVTAPVRHASEVPSAVESVVRLALENVGGPPVRRCCRRSDRAWIEVRGLREDRANQLGEQVLAAVRAHPGVVSANLNYPLSRVFVRFDGARPICDDLCEVISGAEERARARGFTEPASRAPSLPGDDMLLINRLMAAGVTAAGLWGAAVGRTFRLPRLPLPLGASVSVVQYQPRLRELLEDRWGENSTGRVLDMAKFVTRTAGQVPGSHAVALASRLAKTAECRAGQRAWDRYEPQLFSYAECSEFPPSPRFGARGSVERHIDRSAMAQAVAAAGMGLLTGDRDAAARGALVTIPKAARTAREMFASTLGRGLADDHAVLALRPSVWRRLDRVDALVIDPRSLCTAELRVSRIRDVSERDRAAVWERAQELLEAGKLTTGWQPIDGPDPPPEVLIRHAHHPMASAIVAEARRSGLEIVSVDCANLGGLGSAFDELRPLDEGSVEDALGAAVDSLHRSGRTVAVISNAAARACTAADIAIGVLDDGCPPPWCADVLVDDLTAVWWILHAVPAAKSASRRGVEIATGASMLGALLMVPGVRGRGPGPITAGAAAGQFTGYRLARGALKAEMPAPAPAHDWHALSADHVRRLLPPPGGDTAGRRGNVAEQLAGRMRRSVSGFGGAIRAELSDPLTPVLATGALASAMLGSPIDAVMVGSVLVGNATLAATQRIHAERVLSRLLAVQVPKARKVQGAGDHVMTQADRLRPGEVVEVRPNEVVPADARIIEAADIEVDESSLTGESLPVAKHVEATPGAPLAERSCMLYAGSTVVNGTALAVVTAVGAQTQANRAAELASAQQREVGLQTQLHQLTNRVWPLSMAGGAIVTAFGMVRRTRLRDAVSSGVAVAVAAVPEGLPLVATLAQQASARRLTKTGALVRSPRSVEALGRVDVVCFDKTGTLSENRLRVTKVHPVAGLPTEDVLACAAAAAPPADGQPLQHATDAAIMDAAANENRSPSRDSELVAHLPFRSGRSYSASLYGTELSVKGAPEVVLPACEKPDRAIQRTVQQMAESGLRVIAVASRELTAEQAETARDDPDSLAEHCDDGLRLAGLLGLADTPRAEAYALLAALAERGLAVRLITGDHPVTAAAIATELGLPVSTDQVITGSEWENMSRRKQEQAANDRLVFARMSPEQKVQIVQTLERTGRVCAMVGDGVNDAAAIRAATVGIGVAARGSAPARTAADVMLLDGRIESLLDALDEGEQLWQRVRAAVAVLLGGNAGEVLFAIIGSAFTGRAPLNARQLLLVNMLTDALPAAALAVSPPSNGDESAGRGPDEAVLWRAVALRGAATAGGATGAWMLARMTGRRRRAATVALVALVASQLGQTLLDSHSRSVVLTALGSLAAMGVVISTPGVSQLLGCTPLGPVGWTQALGSAAVATGGAALAQRMLSAPPDGQHGDEPTSTPRPGHSGNGQVTAAELPAAQPTPASRH
jgi:cation-transporting P-type ATPase I